MSMLVLPSNPDDLVEVLNDMLEVSTKARIPSAIEWYVNFHYLRGARIYEEVNYQKGNVTAIYDDVFGGSLPFRYEDILLRYRTEVGRLMRLDIRPSVERDGLSLMQTQKAAVAHVLLDTLMRSQRLDSISLDICQTLCMYGTVGGTNWVVREPSPKTTDDEASPGESDVHVISVVKPWELLPLPASVDCTASTRGHCRQRWVPYEWLKEMSAGADEIRLPSKSDPDLKLLDVSPESISIEASPMSEMAPPPLITAATRDLGATRGGRARAGTVDKRLVPYGRLEEVWIPSPSGRLSRYIIKFGDKIVYDKNFEVEARRQSVALPVMPLGVATYTGGVGYFGRSFVGPLVGVNAEVEQMLLSVFRNVQDLDQFGYTFYPDTWGIPRDAIEEAKPGKKIFAYTPDPVQPNMGIHQAQPSSTGEFPGRIADMGIRLIDKLAQQPTDLLAGNAPGRTESGKSLDLLFQTSSVPLGGVAISIAEMMSTIYRSILWNTREWDAFRVNMLSLLDDTVIGLDIDFTTGAINLSNNAVPDPSEILITIRSKEPVNLEQKKNELIIMLDKQLITPMEFRIINRRDGLGLPTGNEVEWQNYIRAVLNNLLMFGDGKTPKKIFTSDFDVPRIHEYVILRRMASPEFSFASPEVQQRFIKRLNDLRALRGIYPDQLPYPEDAAEESVMAAREAQHEMEGAPTGGGMPMEAAAPPPDIMQQIAAAQAGGQMESPVPGLEIPG